MDRDTTPGAHLQSSNKGVCPQDPHRLLTSQTHKLQTTPRTHTQRAPTFSNHPVADAEGVRLELGGRTESSIGESAGMAAALPEDVRARLTEHAKHHSPEHIAAMEKALLQGHSWDAAHTQALERVGT